jgi:hypothetical protein
MLYDSAPAHMELTWNFHMFPGNRNIVRQIVAFDMGVREARADPSYYSKYRQKELEEREVELLKVVAKWPDAELRKAMIKIGRDIQTNVKPQIKIDRKLFEQHLAAPDIVPPGLDLEFARKYH